MIMQKLTILISILLITHCCCYAQKIYSLKSVDAETFDDLQFLKPILAGKKIVQIGESGHGMAEYFKLKTRLVKFLHKEMGFEVIAVEGGIGDTDAAFANSASLSDTAVMRNSFYSTWAFTEAIPLFTYIQQEKKSTHPLLLAGFDNIPTSSYFKKFLQQKLGDQHEISLLFLEMEEKMEKLFKGNFTNKEEAVQTLKQGQQKISTLIDLTQVRKNSITQKLGDTNLYKILLQVLNNRKNTFAINPANLNQQSMEVTRDSLMANNVEWIYNELYPGKKMIVWAHNGHVAKNNSHTTINGKYPEVKRQGEYFNEKLGKAAYTIGLYCYTGRAYAFFIKKEYDLIVPGKESLEGRMAAYRDTISFMDIASNLNNPDAGWLREQISTYEWGKNEQKMIVKDQYDAIILINKINPPNRLPLP